MASDLYVFFGLLALYLGAVWAGIAWVDHRFKDMDDGE